MNEKIMIQQTSVGKATANVLNLLASLQIICPEPGYRAMVFSHDDFRTLLINLEGMKYREASRQESFAPKFLGRTR